jgi:hypothetical protein
MPGGEIQTPLPGAIKRELSCLNYNTTMRTFEIGLTHSYACKIKAKSLAAAKEAAETHITGADQTGIINDPFNGRIEILETVKTVNEAYSI